MGDDSGQMQWFYNVITKQVEQREDGKGTDHLGPYPTRAAAENALASVKAREQRLNAEDAAWTGRAEPNGESTPQ